jgi:protein SCO1/2
MMRRRSRASSALLGLVLILICATGLIGCGRSPAAAARFHASDISGFMPPLEFSLTGPSGAVTAADLRGKITLLYFGYTHCPDVCPTTLADLARVLRRLGPRADSVRVLFVSVDPQRDTPQLLQRYSAAFAPQIVGLTGTDEQLTTLAKRYRAAYRRDPPDADGNYAVYHSSAVFIFDRGGHARLLPPASETTEQMAQDLTALMN